MTYWSTTANGGKIELLKENAGTYILNVHMEPAVGYQAAELNGEEPSTLYQYVKTSGGSQYKWNLFHHGRQGDDTMAFVIGPKQKYDPKKTSKKIMVTRFLQIRSQVLSKLSNSSKMRTRPATQRLSMLQLPTLTR